MAETKPDSDYTFGQVAIQNNFCTIQQVKECLDIQKELRSRGMAPKELGAILIEKGYLTAEQVAQVSRMQGQGKTGGRLTVPGFELLSKLGQGAMGAVYKARQISMDRVVAVKVLSPRYSKDASYVERFLREARAVAKLSHENVITGIDVGEVRGVRYFVMEYVDGNTVADTLRRDGLLPEREALQLVRQIARALEHAHRHELVHRDIKPENIMVTSEGVAKLCDLGLAKRANKEDASLTMDGMSVGTPNYISPEQARGEDTIDIRADIYSLGATLYHMVTGRTAYEGPNPMIVMTKHVTEPLVPPKMRNPSISEGINNLILKMMQKNRVDRYQTPTELIGDIDALIEGEMVAAPAAGAPPAPAPVLRRSGPKSERGERRESRTGRHPSVADAGRRRKSSTLPIIIGAAVLVVAAVGVVILLAGSRPKPPPKTENGEDATRMGTQRVQPVGADRLAEQHQKALDEFRRAKADAREKKPEGFVADLWERIEGNLRVFGGSKFEEEWKRERQVFTREINSYVEEDLWGPMHGAARDLLEKQQKYAEALKKVREFPEAFLYFDKDRKVPTDVHKRREDFIKRVNEALRKRVVEDVGDANRAILEGRTEDALGISDDILAYGGSENAAQVTGIRRRAIEKAWDLELKPPPNKEKFRAARERVAALEERYKGEPEIAALCRDLVARTLDREKKAAEEARSGASAYFNDDFLSVFEASLKKRDIQRARSLAFGLLFGEATRRFQSAFRAKELDPDAVKAYLEPSGGTEYEWMKVVKLCEAAYQGASTQGNSVAAEVAFSLRTLVLIESVLGSAAVGVEHQSKDTTKFKYNFAAPLKEAFSASAVPRKADEPYALMMIMKGGKREVLPMEPAGTGSAAAADLVRLMERSYHRSDYKKEAAADPYFHLREGLVHHYAGEDSWPAAKDAFMRLKEGPAALEIDRFLKLYKGIATPMEEEAARKLYAAMIDLLEKPEKEAVLKECRKLLQEFGHTQYMKAKPALLRGKSRNDVVEQYVNGEMGRAVDIRRPDEEKPADTSAFAGEVEVAGGIHQLTYNFSTQAQFDDWRPLNWESGSFRAEHRDRAAALKGSGTFFFKAPFTGDVSIEVDLTPASDEGIGFTTHGEGDPFKGRGYMGVVNFKPLDFSVEGEDREKLFPPFPIFQLPIDAQRVFAGRVNIGRKVNEVKFVKDKRAKAVFRKSGTKLELLVNGTVVVESDDAVPGGTGSVGISLWSSEAVIHEVRIVGRIPEDWHGLRRPEAAPVEAGPREEADATGMIRLGARSAKINGPADPGNQARYEPGNNNDNIGYWRDARQYVTWQIEVPKPGAYVVEIEYACAQYSQGSQYSVRVANQRLQDTVESTGGWNAFRKKTLGMVTIRSGGDYVLEVRPDRKAGEAVMNLRSITLSPAKK